jgi:hypothetical protein
MATAIATNLENAEVVEQHAVQAASNPLANLWLGLMAVCLGGTLLCTVVLVAWPIIASMVAG